MKNTKVTLREITKENYRECIALKVSSEQEAHVAPNLNSLAESKVNSRLTPLAIYDYKILAREPNDDEPMVGFIMYQIMDGVGFITRLMVGSDYQKRGYGRGAMLEIIRRLKKTPEIEYIGTSVAKGNDYVENFYRGLGFIDGDKIDDREIYLKLDWERE